MAFPFFSGGVKRRDQVVAIDLGARATKAVYLQRHGEVYSLASFVVLEAPPYDKKPSAADRAKHLKEVHQALDAHTKAVTLILGVDQSILRQVEMQVQSMSISDMRAMLKQNPKGYLQQELKDYVFDCYVPSASAAAPGGEGAKGTKTKLVVGGAAEAVINDWQAVVREAGLIPDQIVPGLIGPVNALESAQPDEFAKEALAVVDLGHKNSSISIVRAGQLILNRVVAIGGEKLTTGLAETMNVSSDEAENLKVGMPQEVESTLLPLLVPLGRELRASIDFFEHQHDKAVSQIYVCGAASRSEFFLQALQSELMAPCKSWNPAGNLNVNLPPARRADLEQAAPQLASAVGVALAAF